MDFPNAKDLKKLADACRKAGIKHFKSGNVEFTLSDEVPVSNYKKKASSYMPTKELDVIDKNYQSDELTEEQLLFWSTGTAAQSEDTTQ